MSTDAGFIGSTGMEAEERTLEIIANNLANLNTPAYKEVKGEFADNFYRILRSAGTDAGAGELAPTGIEIGSGCHLVSTTKLFTPGNKKFTGTEMDFMIDGDGFFEVIQPDGSLAYTRAGNLKVINNQVVTNSGYVVQSGFGTIPTGSKLAIAPNGQATVTNPDGSTQTFRIQVARFANPEGLVNLGNNLYAESGASGSAELGNPAENGYGSIAQFHIEGSNVSAIKQMVGMIIAQRAYEMNSRTIQAADEMSATANLIKK